MSSLASTIPNASRALTTRVVNNTSSPFSGPLTPMSQVSGPKMFNKTSMTPIYLNNTPSNSSDMIELDLGSGTPHTPTPSSVSFASNVTKHTTVDEIMGRTRSSSISSVNSASATSACTLTPTPLFTKTSTRSGRTRSIEDVLVSQSVNNTISHPSLSNHVEGVNKVNTNTLLSNATSTSNTVATSGHLETLLESPTTHSLDPHIDSATGLTIDQLAAQLDTTDFDSNYLIEQHEKMVKVDGVTNPNRGSVVEDGEYNVLDQHSEPEAPVPKTAFSEHAPKGGVVPVDEEYNTLNQYEDANFTGVGVDHSVHKEEY